MKRNMKKIIQKTTCLMLILAFVIAIIPTNVFAAGSYSISAGSKTINVNKSTSLYITCKNAAGKFTIRSSNPSVAKVTTSSTWVDGSTMDNAVAIKGVSSGKATITVTPTNVSDDEYNLLTASKSITVTVKAVSTTTTTPKVEEQDNKVSTEKAKSSDASLASLTTKVGNIDFKSETTKYTVNVDKTVTSLGLKAVANNSKATVKITVDENFKTGNNVVTIKVTAEDGTTKTYTVTVIKSKIGSGPLKDLKVTGYEITPSFDPSKLTYSTDVVGDERVEVEYTLTDKDSTVSIEGNENLKIGKNIVKVIVTEKDGTATTYTITVTVQKSAEDILERNNKLWLIVIVILVILVIVETIYIIIKKNKENK